MQSRMKVLMVSKFGLGIHVLPGLKGDELQRRSDSMVIGSFFPGGK